MKKLLKELAELQALAIKTPEQELRIEELILLTSPSDEDEDEDVAPVPATAPTGKIKTEHILTVVPIIPTSGSNSGKQMWIINGNHWSRQEPTPEQNIIVLVERLVLGKKYWNVQGFSIEARALTLDQKIQKITSFDMGYSVAISMLLK